MKANARQSYDSVWDAPVSTTHIITSGIAGTMLGSGAGVNRSMVTRILAAWVFTLPVTIAIAAGLFYALD